MDAAISNACNASGLGRFLFWLLAGCHQAGGIAPMAATTRQRALEDAKRDCRSKLPIC